MRSCHDVNLPAGGTIGIEGIQRFTALLKQEPVSKLPVEYDCQSVHVSLLWWTFVPCAVWDRLQVPHDAEQDKWVNGWIGNKTSKKNKHQQVSKVGYNTVIVGSRLWTRLQTIKYKCITAYLKVYTLFHFIIIL